MASQSDIESLKKSLMLVLRDKSQQYLSNLKQWFSLKITKEEFDRRSRELLSLEHITLHNRLLLLVIARCQSVCLPLQPDARRSQIVEPKHRPVVKQEQSFKSYSSAVAVKEEQKPLIEVNSVKQKQRPNSDLRVKVSAKNLKRTRTPTFEFDEPPRRIKSKLVPPHHEKPKSLLCANELKLPDVALLQGRILVHSFDFDLDGADDKIVHVLVKAVHGFLKNILMSMSKRRHGFQLRHGKVTHACGLDVPDPWLAGTWNLLSAHRSPVAVIESGSETVHGPALRAVHEAAEQGAAYEEACTSQTKRNFLPAANLFDLFETLQAYNNVIPSNSVYVLAMERIAARMK